MKKLLSLLVVVCSFAHGQLLQVIANAPSSGSAPSPGFVNATSGSNTLAHTLTTKTWDTSTVPSGSYCTHYAEATLSGNAGFVSFLYKDSPGTTISVTDDKGGGSSTYSLIGSVAHDATNGYNLAVYETHNLASGVFTVCVNSTAAVAHVSAMTQQWSNIDTSSPVRSSGGNAGANGSTTMSAGSVTPTTGDLVLYWACRTQTPAATSFTKGSQGNITWAKVSGSSDIIDGCMAQWGVYTGSGAFTPQATTSAGSAYVAFAVAIKTATAGTAPTGMYVAGIGHQQVATGVGTSTTHEFPCTGNLLLLTSGGGGNRAITAVSSTPSFTWTAAGAKNTDGNNSTRSWYADNISCTGDVTATITWDNSTGDSSILAYDIVGAATTPFRARFATQGSMLIAATSLFTTDLSASGFQTLGPQPGMTSGMLFGMDIHNLNTGVSLTSPGRPDMIAYGGQSLDGPSDGDQNNDWGHYSTASSSIINWTLGFAQSNEDPGAYAAELNYFLSATGSIVPRVLNNPHASTASNSTTTLTLAVTPLAASHSLAFIASIDNTTAGVTDITLTDNQGNTITNVDSMTTVTGVGKMRTFFVKSATNAATTWTATFTGTTGTHRKNLLQLELDGVDQTNPIDQHILTNAPEDGSGNFCSGNVTNTATNEVALGLAYCGGGICSNVTSVGAGYNYGFEESGQDKTFAEWKIVNSTGSFNACAKDQGIAGQAGMGLIVVKGGT